MISTVSMLHALSKELCPSKTIPEMPSGTIAKDGHAWFTIKVDEGCVVLPNVEYWLLNYTFVSPMMDYSHAKCTNSPYPLGTVVILTQE
jgi:hypothetical protein